MIIAVNTRLRKETQPEGYEKFLFTCLGQLTKKYPQHQFLFIFDKPYAENLSFTKNVLPIVAGPETSNSLRLQYWFNFKIPALLRRYKADVFISMEGICSLRTKKPQCLAVTNLGFVQQPALQKKWLAGFYKKLTPAFLAKAKSIVTVSGFAKSVLIDHYKINADRVDVICPGVDEIFKPMDWDEKEVIKEKKADGKAYFLFSGDINSNSNHINLLKAFSFFKKRQKSNMMLLIAGRADEQFVKDLKTYKFRDEVKLLENLSTEELAKITAAAYAMVYPVFYSDLALPALQAMKCNTPVIVSNTCALPSICGNATLYCNPGDFKDIAENLMLVFKDEDKVKELVAAGKVQIQKHNWENAAAKLMQSIQKAFDN